MADGFVWYELVTQSMDKAIAFYGKVVEWDIRDSGMPGMRYMLFGKDGKDVGGMMTWAATGAPDSKPAWMGHIHTAKLDQELEAVTRDGGNILKPAQDIPGVGRFAVVTDPQGAMHLLFEPAQGQPAPERLAAGAPGNVGWVELMTTDWEKAWDYYSKHYGWQKDNAVDMGPMGIYQTFRTDGPKYTGGMMNMHPIAGTPDGTPPFWRYYLAVADIDAAARRVEEAGGKVTMPAKETPGGARILHAVDDQGGNFSLVQPAK